VLLVAAPALAQAPADSARVLDPAAAWDHVSTAREAAGRDHHEAAARTYLEALANDARLVPTVADELAFQKLWREDAQKAIFYFHRYLARHPDQPNREARKGLALAYSWSGRQGEAIALYRELVDEDPSDAGARLGLGRSLIWDNRLHEGASVLLALEADADVQMGSRRAATHFLRTVLDEYDPTLNLRWNAVQDSDDLSIHRLTGKGRTHLSNVLLELQAGHAWYSRPDTAGISAPRVGLGVVAPLAANWQLHAYGWVDQLKGDGDGAAAWADLDWTFVGADAWLTWLATNRLRLDVGAGRQAIESLQALGNELTMQLVSLSADWRLNRAWTMAAVGQQGDLSDDNRRRRANVRLLWRREGRVEVRLGPSFTYMEHTTAYPGGYWAPARVRNIAMEAMVVRRWDRLVARVEGNLGLETEQDADTITVGSVSGHLGWRLAPRWLLSLDGGHSRSRFASATGYNRTTASLGIRALF